MLNNATSLPPKSVHDGRGLVRTWEHGIVAEPSLGVLECVTLRGQCGDGKDLAQAGVRERSPILGQWVVVLYSKDD